MSQRRNAERRGRFAETLAAFALRLKGYRILEKRMKTPVGEIDLIAQRGNLVAFIEVKARKTETLALEAITPHARKRIIRAAELWMAHKPALQTHDWRFDVMMVRPRRWPTHLPDAWRPER